MLSVCHDSMIQNSFPISLDLLKVKGTQTRSRGGGTSSNLGGPLLNFHLQCSLFHRCILGLKYNGKLTIIDLTSSSTRLSTFIIQNSSLNCGFEGK